MFYQTYTGRMLDLANPDPAQVCILDIAHHLSIEPRFGGATTVPYSVAEHSVRVAQTTALGNRTIRLQKLLHDAPEYVLKDLPRPLRLALGDAYASLYARWWEAIRIGLALPFDAFDPEVHHADDCLLGTEARDLLPGCGPPWVGLPAPLSHVIEPWPAEKAEREFLAEYRFCLHGTPRTLGPAPRLKNLAGG